MVNDQFNKDCVCFYKNRNENLFNCHRDLNKNREKKKYLTCRYIFSEFQVLRIIFNKEKKFKKASFNASEKLSPTKYTFMTQYLKN